ncbi:unnamed protein product, partial [Didymodactylos carnosus]
LIAGPILRYREIAHLLEERRISRQGFAEGIIRFTIGLSKKMLIANTLGATADAVFNLRVQNLDASLAWLGLLTYTLQIYSDFSAYSDMGIGLANMFGIRFPENFDYPYVLVAAHTYINVKFFGVSGVRKVIVGKKGWLYYDAHEAQDGIGFAGWQGKIPYSKAQLTAIERNLEAQKVWFDKRNIILIVIPCPDKHSIYPEYLPWRFKG